MATARTMASAPERPQRTSTTNRPPKIRGFHLIPDTVACEGSTTVALIFDEIPDSSGKGKVEICVRSSEKTERIVATAINQTSFRFTAPENRAGEVPVTIFVGGIEFASTHLNYCQENAHLVTGVSQLYLQLLGKLCRYVYLLQTRQKIPSPMQELDKFLAELFEDKDDTSKIAPKVFEELFDILRHSPSDVIQSPYEFPTLLHFTAEFGLEKLGEKLMDLPGSERAIQVLNEQRLTPNMIARKNGHSSLSAMLSGNNTNHSNLTVKPSSNRKTLMPGEVDFLQSRKSYQDNSSDYVTADPSDSAVSDDTYIILSCPTQSQTQKPSAPKQLPPKLSAKSKPPPGIGSSTPSPDHKLPPRASQNHPPPPPIVPRRESRDSGAYDEEAETPPPPPITSRPGVSRHGSELGSGYNRPSRLPDQNNKQDIHLQLSRPVPLHPGSRGPSLTK